MVITREELVSRKCGTLFYAVPLFNWTAFYNSVVFCFLLYHRVPLWGLKDATPNVTFTMYLCLVLAMIGHLLTMCATLQLEMIALALSIFMMLIVLVIGAFQAMWITVAMSAVSLVCSVSLLIWLFNQNSFTFNECKQGKCAPVLFLVPIGNFIAFGANLVFIALLYAKVDLFNWGDGFKDFSAWVYVALTAMMAAHLAAVYATGLFNIPVMEWCVVGMLLALLVCLWQALWYTVLMSILSIALSGGLIFWIQHEPAGSPHYDDYGDGYSQYGTKDYSSDYNSFYY